MYVRVFLLAGFVASLSGCLDSGKRVEAILRVNRELSDGNSADFMIYKETQANLVKSNYVINAALRDPDLANIKGLTPSSLKHSIQVFAQDNNELITVSMACGSNSPGQASVILNKILSMYETEIVNKDRMEKISTLTKLRKRYQRLFEDIQKKTDETAQLGKQLGATSSQTVELSLQRKTKNLLQLNRQLIAKNLELIEQEQLEQPEKIDVARKQIEYLTGEIEQTIEEIAQFGTANGDLEARRNDLLALQRDLQTVRAEMGRLEIELDGPRRVAVIQSAYLAN